MKLKSRKQFEKEMVKEYRGFETGNNNGNRFNALIDIHFQRYGNTGLNMQLAKDYETELRRRSV